MSLILTCHEIVKYGSHHFCVYTSQRIFTFRSSCLAGSRQRRTKNRLTLPQSHIVHPCLGHQRFFPFPPTKSRKTGMKWAGCVRNNFCQIYQSKSERIVKRTRNYISKCLLFIIPNWLP